MKVYRYLSEKELNNILSGQTETLGNVFSHDKHIRKNTHKYKKDTKYIHFFKTPNSMKMLSYLYRKIDTPFYFCTFEIPFNILAMHGGKGFYPASGYDNINTLREYAIPLEMFDPNWLKEYTIDTERSKLSFSDVEKLCNER